MVWCHPVWWGGLPALIKGFIDRTFLPGIMFDYNEAKLGGMGWDGHLVGRTARIITTMDTPPILYRWLYNAPSVNQLKKTTLEFCGVKPVKVTQFGPVKGSRPETRQRWVDSVYQLGAKGSSSFGTLLWLPRKQPLAFLRSAFVVKNDTQFCGCLVSPPAVPLNRLKALC